MRADSARGSDAAPIGVPSGSQARDVQTQRAAVLTPAAAAKRLRILVAEDDPMSRLVMRGLLEQAGHRVVLVPDGVQALSSWRAEEFDLVFMDVQMPYLDGTEASRLIRGLERGSARHRCRIVAVTAFATDACRSRCLAAGMDEFITKPITPEALGAALEALER